MTKKSTAIGTAILGFWLVTMAALLEREVLPRYLSPRPPAAAIQDYDRWYGVYIDETSRVGVIHLASAATKRDGVSGVELSLDARVNLNLLDSATDMYAEAVVWTPFDGAVEFSGSLTSGEHDFAASGTVRDGVLDARVDTGDQSFPVQWPVGEFNTTTALFSSGATLPALAVGESTYMPAFDPLTMKTAQATITSLGRELVEVGGERVAVSVYETTLSGITSRVWVDADGEIVQAETPYGFTLRRLTAAEAALPADASDADLLAMAAIVPAGETPFRGARRMVARIEGFDTELDLPSSAHQIVGDNHVTIASPDEPGSNGSTELEPALLAESLASDPLIPATHPTILTEANRIVGDAEGIWPRALRLYDWVYENIEKTPVPTIPSALDVLQTREGDCNEHTVLFTALARAIGIPTRIAVGVVWSEELEAFYYHAWPEVFVNEWIPMDPTLGQPVADATHIKMLEGDIQRWPKLIAFLGRTTIEILEVE